MNMSGGWNVAFTVNGHQCGPVFIGRKTLFHRPAHIYMLLPAFFVFFFRFHGYFIRQAIGGKQDATAPDRGGGKRKSRTHAAVFLSPAFGRSRNPLTAGSYLHF
jgi:hypothetical protein